MIRADECRPGRSHSWEPVSGYCAHGCGNRDDGRIVSRSGDVIKPGPRYSMAQLDVFRLRSTRAYLRTLAPEIRERADELAVIEWLRIRLERDFLNEE